MIGTCTLLVVAALAPTASSDQTNITPVEKIHFEPCVLYSTTGTQRLEAECANVAMPLDPDLAEPNSPHITIEVVRKRSLAPEPSQDALTIINGGPGASSISLYADLAPSLRRVLRERDIVVVDQRGTGRSTPLACPELEADAIESNIETIADAARTCLSSLQEDPRFFTTSVAVRDLEYIRRALGYEQLTIYGVSYGTRVAQHYSRRYPERTRALIIDGVLPAPMALGPQVSLNAQTTLDEIFKRCSETPACQTAFPSLVSDFSRLRTEIRSNPPNVGLQDPTTGRNQELLLTYPLMAIVLRLLSYAPETAALIPLIIHEAANERNYLPFAAQALRLTSQLSESMSYGMHNAVVCTEDVPFYDFDFEEMAALLQNTYLGAEQLDGLRTICNNWPKGYIDKDLKAPLDVNVPTLLLSGEFDPITPPDNAEITIAHLPNAKHFVAPGQGHGVIARGCVNKIATDFISTPILQELDTDCLDRLNADPFFIDLMGPAR